MHAMFMALGKAPASISAGWSDLSGSPGLDVRTNEDRTITWPGGGTRTITRSGSATGVTREYRIDSGSWVSYTVGFSLTSGQTVAWRDTFTANLSATQTISVDGITLDQFTSEASGF